VLKILADQFSMPSLTEPWMAGSEAGHKWPVCEPAMVSWA
jgi:hypothetical protein